MKNHLNHNERNCSIENRRQAISTASLFDLFRQYRQHLKVWSVLTALPGILTLQAPDSPAQKPTTMSELPISGNSVRENHLFAANTENLGFFSRFVEGDDCPGESVPSGNYTSSTPFIDVGSTVGRNDTVSSICAPYCYSAYSTPGPDHIYTFRIASMGSNARIEVSATSANYNPAIYLLQENSSAGCPAGTGNNVSNNFNRWIYRSQNGVAVMELASAPTNVPLFLIIDSESPNNDNSGTFMVRLQGVTVNGAAGTTRARFDFDGDGKEDISVFRPTDRTWYLNRSTAGFTSAQFGLPTDELTPEDFDGDGITDISVYRAGFWHWIASSNGIYNVENFGSPSDVPLPADYDGDERAELAVYRSGQWWIQNISTRQTNVFQFGLGSDQPVPADFDGDGRTDPAVYRGGEWHILNSANGYTVANFGLNTDKPVVGDFDGDRKADLVVYRNGTWYLMQSTNGLGIFQWGIATDVPSAGDFDGDGRFDPTVFRDGVWYLMQSSGGISIQHFGLAGDSPIPSVFTR